MAQTTFSRAEYNGIVATAGFRGDDIFRAAAIAFRESGGRPFQAPNPVPVGGGCKGPGSHHATGMWQFVPACFPQFDEARLTSDPVYASQCAYKMSNGGSDFSAWKPDGPHGSRSPFESTNVAAQTAAGIKMPSGAIIQAAGVDPTTLAGHGDIGAAVPGLNIANPLDSVVAFFAMLGKWHTWLVVLETLGGAVMIVVGIVAINKDQNIV